MQNAAVSFTQSETRTAAKKRNKKKNTVNQMGLGFFFFVFFFGRPVWLKPEKERVKEERKSSCWIMGNNNKNIRRPCYPDQRVLLDQKHATALPHSMCFV